MNKPAFYFGLAACFISFYAAGLFSPWNFSPAPLASISTSKRLVQSVQANGTPLPGHDVPAKDAPKALAEESGLALFDTLFSGANPLGPFPTVERALTDRFNAPYPAKEHEAHLEVVSRMGILKAMNNAYQGSSSNSDQPALLNFYLTIASREEENPAVRRGAYRNLTAVAGKLDEDDRMSLLSHVPERFLANAGKSEAEILQEVFGRGH